MGDFQKLDVWQLAKGSSAEVITQTIIAEEIGYIASDQKTESIIKCELISKKLYKLIENRRKQL